MEQHAGEMRNITAPRLGREARCDVSDIGRMLQCSWVRAASVCAHAYGSRPGSHTHRPLLRLLRYLYGSWTQNFPHDSPHPGGTADASGLAAGHYYPGGACPPGADPPASGGGQDDQRHCRHGRHQPPLCLQMGTTVSGAGRGGIGRPTGSGLPARVASPGFREQRNRKPG